MRAIDVCAGAGGLSLGLKRAGFETLGVEIDPDAVAVHRRHVGPCIEASIETWSPTERVDLVAGGVPCFAAGTLILTRVGYVPIEAVAVGAEVLTHLGRWRRVTATMTTPNSPIVSVSAQGVPGVLTTPEHPFLARERMPTRPRRIGNPSWVPSKELSTAHYLGQTLPPLESDERSIEFWRLVGRYLADGWISDSKRTSKVPPGRRGSRVNSRSHRVVICCAASEESALAARIEAAGFKTPSPQRERTVVKFHISSVDFVAFLRQFGRYAHGKLVPGIALALPVEKSAALLGGYMSGDGYEYPGGRSASTVSKALALGMALVAQCAHGVVASVRRCILPRQCTIEGRICNQRDFYKLTVPASNRSAIVDDRYGWKLVRRVEVVGRGTVYNIAVDEDESYMADGAIVHNCQPFSASGKRLGTFDPRGCSQCERIECECVEGDAA